MAVEDRRARAVREIRLRRSLGIARRRARVPRQVFPRAIVREYARELLAVVARAEGAVAPLLEVLPRLLDSAARERADAGEGRRVREEVDRVRRQLDDALRSADLDRVLGNLARRVADFNREQLGRQVHAALGADVLQDRGLAAVFEGFVAENVALIRDLGPRVLGQVERAVTRAVASGTPHPELAREIEDSFRVSRDRARLIARDQVGKLYGQVNGARQRTLGVTRYVWRTVRDERVRSEHAEREGQTFSWDDPPEDGHPGEPINCRCSAEPLFDEILGDL